MIKKLFMDDNPEGKQYYPIIYWREEDMLQKFTTIELQYGSFEHLAYEEYAHPNIRSNSYFACWCYNSVPSYSRVQECYDDGRVIMGNVNVFSSYLNQYDKICPKCAWGFMAFMTHVAFMSKDCSRIRFKLGGVAVPKDRVFEWYYSYCRKIHERLNAEDYEDAFTDSDRNRLDRAFIEKHIQKEIKLMEKSDRVDTLFYNGKAKDVAKEYINWLKLKIKGDKPENRLTSSPIKCFKDYVRKQEKLEKLEELMNGKKGKRAALVVKAAVEIGIIDKPPFSVLKSKFGWIGCEAGFNRYYSSNEFQKEVDSYKNELE